MSAALRMTLDEARGIALTAQRLFHRPIVPQPGLQDVHALIERLGVIQVDTISVVERSQYLVLWSRLGAYDASLLDALLHPHRHIFECWSHAASILPMSDYPYHKRRLLDEDMLWSGDREWMAQSSAVLQRTLDTIRQRGPLASADFEPSASDSRPDPWTWYGKESRRALQILWTRGELMVHSRRGGQKVYDLPERVLADVCGANQPQHHELPSTQEQVRHFASRTAQALGLVTPSWLWDYFRMAPPAAQHGSRRASAAAMLEALAREGRLIPVEVEGLAEPGFLDSARLADLEDWRAGARPTHTTLLSPFDSLIWHRARTRALWEYDVCFEAYVVPAQRRYGYYCLAILHQGRIVGRLDPKMERDAGRLLVRAAYLEPGVTPDAALLDGVAAALRDLARFLGAATVEIERATPARLASGLRSRLQGAARKARQPAAVASRPASSSAASRR